MRKAMTVASLSVATIVTIGALNGTKASGPLGIFAVIERIQFYPDEAHAERIQVWGAFAYQECPTESQFRSGTAARDGWMTSAQRGYM